MSEANVTTDHDAIRHWIEERKGRPCKVAGTEGRDGEGILRIDFGDKDAKLEDISWEEFFETFDDRNLAFLHQDKTADGKTSRFNKFVARDAHEHEHGRDAHEHEHARDAHEHEHARDAHGHSAAKSGHKGGQH